MGPIRIRTSSVRLARRGAAAQVDGKGLMTVHLAGAHQGVEAGHVSPACWHHIVLVFSSAGPKVEVWPS